MGRPPAVTRIAPADLVQAQRIVDDAARHPREQLRARILLALAEQLARREQGSQGRVAEELDLHPAFVGKVLQTYRDEGLQAALCWNDVVRPQPSPTPEMDDARRRRPASTPEMAEALRTLLTEPPPERAAAGRWTQKLLAEELKARGFACSTFTVAQALAAQRRS